MTSRRTEFADFILDLLDFMEEKLREAQQDEASRVGAVNDAAGAVAPLRDGLRENELVQAQFMLVFDNELYEPDAGATWRGCPVPTSRRKPRPSSSRTAPSLRCGRSWAQPKESTNSGRYPTRIAWRRLAKSRDPPMAADPKPTRKKRRRSQREPDVYYVVAMDDGTGATLSA
jgi:hypothetical protein